MLSYEQLDHIADAYNPLLALISLIYIVSAGWQKNWPLLARRFASALGVLLIAYAVTFLDNALHIWPALGLDYSTHTAVAFAMVVFLSLNMRPLRLLWCLSLLAYLLLMRYQNYHTFGDMLSTMMVLAAPMILWSAYLQRRPKVETASI